MEAHENANNLKKFRETIGYSQKDVALLLGFDYVKNISRWENGETFPSIEYLFALSHLYNASPSELYPSVWQSLQIETIKKRQSLPQRKGGSSNDYFFL